MLDDGIGFEGTIYQWLVSFYEEFINSVDEVDSDFFLDLGLEKSDFEYLLDSENPDTKRLLPQLIVFVESRAHFFNISTSMHFADVCMGVIIGYTAGLKDIL
jgi:hypothetical protein